MDTFMIFVVGMVMAVGRAWDGSASWFLAGFGMSAKAIWSGAGVAGFAQLGDISAYRITIKYGL